MVCGFMKKDGVACQRKGKCPWHKECPICLDYGTSKGPFKKLPTCTHEFHEECIDTWKSRGNRTCPVCRSEFVKPEYRVNLSITRLSDGQVHTEQMTIMETMAREISDIFNLNFQNIETPNVVTDLIFEVENEEILREIFGEIGMTLNEPFPF